MGGVIRVGLLRESFRTSELERLMVGLDVGTGRSYYLKVCMSYHLSDAMRCGRVDNANRK